MFNLLKWMHNIEMLLAALGENFRQTGQFSFLVTVYCMSRHWR